jgi:allophanate hydrolase subunit 1
MLNEFTGFKTIPDLVRIPVCYDEEFAIDLAWIAQQKKLAPEEIIQPAYFTAVPCIYAGIFAGLRVYGASGR